MSAAPLQEGIYHAPGRRPGRHFGLLFLRVRPGFDASAAAGELGRLWETYQQLKAGRVRDLPGVALPVENDAMTVLLGFGRNAFELDGTALARPHGLADAYLFRSADPAGGGPLLRGSGLRYAPDVRANLATEAFCIQVIAESKLAVDRAVVETWKALADRGEPVLELTTFYLGNQRNDHRSWIDFHDGLSNLRSEDRESVIAIGPGADEAWAVGGTYLAFLRLAVDLAGWRRLGRADQELAVGRDKLSGCPIVAFDGPDPRADPGCPVAGTQISESANDGPFAEPPEVSDARLRTSHVQRANHHVRPASDSGSRRVFRQGYEFLEWAAEAPGFRAGLNFVSFQDTPARLLKMLTAAGWLGGANFGGDELGHPELASLLSVHAAGVYFVAPVVAGEPFPGAAALGVEVVAPPEPAPLRPTTVAGGAPAAAG
ncbi:MAG: deferrochelatase/peroxidase EfeB [Solirubrobacteraceae bacterium]|jgi:deferrochelatase/peroxidase EfeB|nr:deferrochelatase/peroxidase EfeB [Solirubrobacteraceae bacterium]